MATIGVDTLVGGESSSLTTVTDWRRLTGAETGAAVGLFAFARADWVAAFSGESLQVTSGLFIMVGTD